MPDYKEMYLHLMRETEKAIRTLTEAQQACEELYLREDGPALTQESLSADYPQFASSLFNLIQNSETRMGVRRKR